MITIKKLSKKIEESLEEMVRRSDNAAYFLQRVVLPQYIQAQSQRWMTEGNSQGFGWKALNPAYRARKRTMFAAYPGGGSKMMVATSHLVDAVLLRNNYSQKMITGRKMILSTSLNYGEYADEERTYTKFSPEWKKMLAQTYSTYVRTGDVS